jgi:hypothetical protein
MPKRSNSFQDLVALIERALAPVGAKITESAEVSGEDGSTREIDVLLESAIGSYAIRIAVEAKDEARKMDLVKFESIVGKYSKMTQLKIDKVVVVARAGFSKAVIKRAARENITLLTLERAMTADWASFPQKVTFRIPPHLAMFEIEPPFNSPQLDVALARGRLICSCCGRDHGNPREIAMNMLSDPQLRDQLRRISSVTNKPACVRPTWELGPNVNLVDGDVRIPVSKLIAHFHCTEARGNLDVAAYKHGSHLIHHLQGSAGGHEFQIVVPHGPQSPKITMKIDTLKPQLRSPTEVPVPVVETPSFLAEQLPDGVEDEIKRFEDSIHSANVQVHRQFCVHDFSRAIDVKVPLVIDSFLTRTTRIRTAVLFLGSSAEREHWLPWANQLSFGAEIDRVVVFGAAPIPMEKATRVVQVSQIGELSSNFIPPVVIFGHRFTDLEFDLMGDEPRVFGKTDGVEFELPPKMRVPLIALPQMILQVLASKTMELVADDVRQMRCTANDFRYRFSASLPVEAQLQAFGLNQSVGLIKGVATVRTLVSACARGEIADLANGTRLRFYPESQGFPGVEGGTLEHPDSFTVTGSSDPAIYAATREITLNGEEFQGLFGEIPQIVRNSPNRIFHIKWQGGNWICQPFGLAAFPNETMRMPGTNDGAKLGAAGGAGGGG